MMNTVIKTRNELEVVYGHREPIPLKPDRNVDYQVYVERIAAVTAEREELKIKPSRQFRDLTEIF